MSINAILFNIPTNNLGSCILGLNLNFPGKLYISKNGQQTSIAVMLGYDNVSVMKSKIKDITAVPPENIQEVYVSESFNINAANKEKDGSFNLLEKLASYDTSAKAIDGCTKYIKELCKDDNVKYDSLVVSRTVSASNEEKDLVDFEFVILFSATDHVRLGNRRPA